MKLLEGRNRHVTIAWGVWIGMVLLLARYVIVYGGRLPAGEEWGLVRYLRPDAHIGLADLWAPQSEHHVPLGKAVWLGLATTTHDLRAGAWASVILLSACAVLCLGAARRLRGRTSFTDALFPLLFLHGGQGESALNAFHVQFALGATLAVLGLVLLAESDERPRMGRIAWLGLVTCALPGAGIGAAVLAIPSGVWFVYVWRCARRSREVGDRQTGRWALAAAIVLFAAVALCVHDFRLQPGAVMPEVGSWAATSAHLLAGALGKPTGVLGLVGAGVVVAALAWTIVVLGWAYFDTDTSRARALGIAVVLAASLSSAAFAGFVHARDVDGASIVARYSMMAAPAWCAFGLAAVLAWEWRWARALGFALFLAAALAWLPNLFAGERAGQLRRTRERAVAADLARHRPIDEIAAARCGEFGVPEEALAAGLRDLEAAGLLAGLEGSAVPPVVSGPRASARGETDPASVDAPPQASPPPVPGTGPAAGQTPAPVAFPAGPPFDVLRSSPIPPTRTEDVLVRRSAGQPVLLARDGATLSFALGKEPAEITGVFGVQSDLARMGQAPRVRFDIVVRRPDGTATHVFQRTLDVRAMPSDAGPQTLRVPLEAAYAQGVVELRITHEGEPKLEWAGYWRDVLVR